MKYCPRCSQRTGDHQYLCSNCGNVLVIETQMLSPETAITDFKKASSTTDTLRYRRNALLMFAFEDYPSFPLAFQIYNPVILGRQSTTDHDSSFVNLEAYDAVAHGVSRRHAKLAYHDQKLTIIDLESSNHTFINDDPLQPNLEYPLSDGDSIALGRLKFRLYIDME